MSSENLHLNKDKKKQNKLNNEESVTQCVAQLLLIGVIKDIIDTFAE